MGHGKGEPRGGRGRVRERRGGEEERRKEEECFFLFCLIDPGKKRILPGNTGFGGQKRASL